MSPHPSSLSWSRIGLDYVTGKSCCSSQNLVINLYFLLYLDLTPSPASPDEVVLAFLPRFHWTYFFWFSITDLSSLKILPMYFWKFLGLPHDQSSSPHLSHRYSAVPYATEFLLLLMTSCLPPPTVSCNSRAPKL